MSQTDRMPIFNLKAVVQDTGIKPDTLRAWERRYGIPEPQRTDSGHRLYTQRDIHILKWLIQRQDEGLSISRAVALWRKLEKEQGDPLLQATMRKDATPPSSAPGSEFASSAARRSASAERSVHTERAEGDHLDSLHEQWVAAALAFDEQTADAVLTSAFGLFSPEIVCSNIIQRGLATIGEGWFQGRVTVQQEHFASAMAIRRLDSLISATPAPTRPGRILVGCPPEEAHTFVPLMLSLLLRRKGWNVIYLGADVPVQSLALTITSARPDLVILTAQQLHTVVGLKEMAAVLTDNHVPLGYGGLIFNRFPTLQRILSGYFLGNDLQRAVQAVEQVMAAPRPRLADEVVGSEYREALRQFQEKRPQIESEIWQRLEDIELPQRHINQGNANFGRSIEAALALGDMAYLGPDLQWIQEILDSHYRIPRFMVRDFLATYRDSVRAVMAENGHKITDWLDRVLSDPESEPQSQAKRRNRPEHGRHPDVKSVHGTTLRDGEPNDPASPSATWSETNTDPGEHGPFGNKGPKGPTNLQRN